MKKSLILFFTFFLSIGYVNSQSLDFGLNENESSTSIGADVLYSDFNPLRVMGGLFDTDDKLLAGNYEWIEVLLPDYEGIVEFSWKFYGWEPYVRYYEIIRPGAPPKSSVMLCVPSNANKPQTTIVATALYNDSRSNVDYVRTFYLVK